jgi:hypothetical protein
MLHGRSTHGVQAGLARHVLHPRMLNDLDAEALVVWVCPREVAVGEQAAGVVAADELELFPVAHDVSVLYWTRRKRQPCLRFGQERSLPRLCVTLCYCEVRAPRYYVVLRRSQKCGIRMFG